MHDTDEYIDVSICEVMLDISLMGRTALMSGGHWYLQYNDSKGRNRTVGWTSADPTNTNIFHILGIPDTFSSGKSNYLGENHRKITEFKCPPGALKRIFAIDTSNTVYKLDGYNCRYMLVDMVMKYLDVHAKQRILETINVFQILHVEIPVYLPYRMRPLSIDVSFDYSDHCDRMERVLCGLRHDTHEN